LQWPAKAVSFRETFAGVAGELNATSRNETPYRDATGLAVRDPHHGDPADETFHPIVPIDDHRTDEEIAECIRARARAYNGTWRWFLEAGQNCHTFQLALLQGCRILEPAPYVSRISSLKYS
jgi:hypothetical protein